MKKKLLLIVPTLLALSIISCTDKDFVYRDKGTSQSNCNSLISLGINNDETVEAFSGIVECYTQLHEIPNSQGWQNEHGSERISSPERYRLAFVEMVERGRGILLESQLSDLKLRLSKNTQSVVIVYVHGWRHDAGIGNGNVRKFRTLLAYSRSFLNTRCIETKTYCDAELTGVYVSWRGRSFNEPPNPEPKILWSIGAAPTLWGRKAQSERLARGNPSSIEYVLGGIQDELSLVTGDPNADKMLM